MSTAQKLRELADVIEKGELSEEDKVAMAEASQNLQSIATTDALKSEPGKTVLRSEWAKMTPQQSSAFFQAGGRVVDN